MSFFGGLISVVNTNELFNESIFSQVKLRFEVKFVRIL